MDVLTKSKSKKPQKKKYKSSPLLSNTRQPGNMSVAEWQTILRRQIAAKPGFTIKNTGEGFVFSDYQVYNAGTKNTYKVAL